jgi:hypothetical protein
MFMGVNKMMNLNLVVFGEQEISRNKKTDCTYGSRFSKVYRWSGSIGMEIVRA